MMRIVLTEEQARILAAAPLEAVEVCDAQGKVLRSIPAAEAPAELRDIRRAKDCKGPFFSGEEVQQMLLKLEETWQREGPFGMERVREIIANRDATPEVAHGVSGDMGR